MDGIMIHNEKNKPRYFQRGLSEAINHYRPFNLFIVNALTQNHSIYASMATRNFFMAFFSS